MATSKRVAARGGDAALIDDRIDALGDWRGDTLARVRKLIHQADPTVVETVKWRGVPVWEHAGILCTGETYKTAVKLTFAHGAKLPDPAGLFNASLEGGTRRAIDLRRGDRLDATAFKALIRAAVAFNTAKAATAKTRAKKVAAPVLLAGGNPRIAKGDGEAPVQAWIAAVPGWKSAAAARLDALVERHVPGVRKAVKWNSPMYAVADRGWFLSLHAYARYLKIAFFDGAALKPPPPVDSKSPKVRYLHLHEDDTLDEAQFARWLKQAVRLPGWTI